MVASFESFLIMLQNIEEMIAEYLDIADSVIIGQKA